MKKLIATTCDTSPLPAAVEQEQADAKGEQFVYVQKDNVFMGKDGEWHLVQDKIPYDKTVNERSVEHNAEIGESCQRGFDADFDIAKTRSIQSPRLSAPHATIAGALFDFCGMLTSQDEETHFSAHHLTSPAVNMLRRFAAKRGLKIDDANIAGWPATLSQPPVVEAPSDGFQKALRKCLNYIENTENELGIKLDCGNAARDTLAAQPAKQDNMRQVLQNVRNCLERANNDGKTITDTLWYTDYETLFDYIDAKLECVSGTGIPTAQPASGDALFKQFLSAADRAGITRLNFTNPAQGTQAVPDELWEFEKFLTNKGRASNYLGDGQFGGGNQLAYDAWHARAELAAAPKPPAVREGGAS